MMCMNAPHASFWMIKEKEKQMFFMHKNQHLFMDSD